MKNLERESTNASLIANTIICLRQIRGSIFPYISLSQVSVLPELALSDAQDLILTAAAYFIDPYFEQNSEQNNNQYSELLQRLIIKYENYRPYCARDASAYTFGVDSFRTRLRLFETLSEVDGDITQSHVWKGAVGFDNGKLVQGLNFFNNRLGVFAPLSSDYLKAALFQRVLIKRGYNHFVLRPVILSPALDSDPSQGFGQYDRSFDDAIDEIVIYTDFDSDGDTRRATVIAARNLYPEKIIHGAAPW